VCSETATARRYSEICASGHENVETFLDFLLDVHAAQEVMSTWSSYR
jgi:hypothetical protein